jgi:hypothetical protein
MTMSAFYQILTTALGTSQYNIYSADVSSTGLYNSTPCNFFNSDQPCVTQLQLRFVEMDIESRTIIHKHDKVQIFVHEGGIVGGVMFFTWFLGLLAPVPEDDLDELDELAQQAHQQVPQHSAQQ